MKCFCKVACFDSNGRLWSPGETQEIKAGAKIPDHFEASAPEKIEEAPEIRAFSQMNTSGPVEDGSKGPVAISQLGKPLKGAKNK